MADQYRDCLVCGKSFKACNTCKKDIDEMLQWRRVVCCPEHFLYHMPIIQYSRGKINKETARNELQSAIDTYGNIEFCDNVKGIVGEILAEDTIQKDIIEMSFEDNVVVENKKHKNKNKVE